MQNYDDLSGSRKALFDKLCDAIRNKDDFGDILRTANNDNNDDVQAVLKTRTGVDCIKKHGLISRFTLLDYAVHHDNEQAACNIVEFVDPSILGRLLHKRIGIFGCSSLTTLCYIEVKNFNKITEKVQERFIQPTAARLHKAIASDDLECANDILNSIRKDCHFSELFVPIVFSSVAEAKQLSMKDNKTIIAYIKDKMLESPNSQVNETQGAEAKEKPVRYVR